MNITALICTLREMIFPGMGALAIAFLITCIPGISDSESTFKNKK